MKLMGKGAIDGLRRPKKFCVIFVISLALKLSCGFFVVVMLVAPSLFCLFPNSPPASSSSGRLSVLVAWRKNEKRGGK